MLAYQDLSDPVTAPNFKILLNTFNASNPNIKLNIEYNFDEAYHNKLQAMLVAGQLPDVLFLWPGKRTGSVTESGQIKDLKPRLKGTKRNLPRWLWRLRGRKVKCGSFQNR